jgi:hypothetical protein
MISLKVFVIAILLDVDLQQVGFAWHLYAGKHAQI